MKNVYRHLILLSVIVASTLYAGGDKFSARLVGMGRTFTAVSRGLDAVGTNPANLALNDRDATVTLNLIPLGLSIGSDFINYKIYNDFFTGVPDPTNPDNRIARKLSDQDKNDILALFPGGIARTQARFEMAPIGLSLQVGDFGLAIVPSIQVANNFDLPEGYMKLLLNGFGENGTKYSLNGTALNASAIGELNVSMAYILPMQLPSIDEISVGIGVKYLVGLAYVGTDHYNGSIQTTDVKAYTNQSTGETVYLPNKIAADFDFLQYYAYDSTDYQPVGSGLGFDIGVSANVVNAVRVGISVTDIGSITWDKHTKAIYGQSSVEVEGFDSRHQDTLTNAFKGNTVDTTSFVKSLPTALHIGAEVKMDDLITDIPFRWTIAADMHLGFNDAPGNTKLAQFAIGTELDPLAGWLPLRTGILLGGRERFGWSAGFGIHLANTFDLDFATQSIAILTNPDSFRTGSFTMGMRFRF